MTVVGGTPKENISAVAVQSFSSLNKIDNEIYWVSSNVTNDEKNT